MKVLLAALEICYKQAGRRRKKHVKVNMGIFAGFVANTLSFTKLVGIIFI
jgi:hypothetical protein